jgi:hypothetical protein
MRTENGREAAMQQQIEELSRMTVSQLRQKYLGVFGEESRSNHKQFLFRRIAWRIQALAEGGLSERARRRAHPARARWADHGQLASGRQSHIPPTDRHGDEPLMGCWKVRVSLAAGLFRGLPADPFRQTVF